jgi:hypothetical protein
LTDWASIGRRNALECLSSISSSSSPSSSCDDHAATTSLLFFQDILSVIEQIFNKAFPSSSSRNALPSSASASAFAFSSSVRPGSNNNNHNHNNKHLGVGPAVKAAFDKYKLQRKECRDVDSETSKDEDLAAEEEEDIDKEEEDSLIANLMEIGRREYKIASATAVVELLHFEMLLERENGNCLLGCCSALTLLHSSSAFLSAPATPKLLTLLLRQWNTAEGKIYIY